MIVLSIGPSPKGICTFAAWTDLILQLLVGEL